MSDLNECFSVGNNLRSNGVYWVANSSSKTSRSATFSSNFKSLGVLLFLEVRCLSRAVSQSWFFHLSVIWRNDECIYSLSLEISCSQLKHFGVLTSLFKSQNVSVSQKKTLVSGSLRCCCSLASLYHSPLHDITKIFEVPVSHANWLTPAFSDSSVF